MSCEIPQDKRASGCARAPGVVQSRHNAIAKLAAVGDSLLADSVDQKRILIGRPTFLMRIN